MKRNRIRELREDRDWTQQEVAKRLGLNRRTYCAYENNIEMIPHSVLASISELFHTNIEYLLNLTDQMEPYPRIEKKQKTIY